MFRNLASDNKQHEGNCYLLSLICTCPYCLNLWHNANSLYCKTLLNTCSNADNSLATIARNRKGLLEPLEKLYKFGKWVVNQFLHLLSLSFIKILFIEKITKSVYNAYLVNMEQQSKLPDCHPVSPFIVQRLGRKIVSEYCSRLSKVKRIIVDYYKINQCLHYILLLSLFLIDYKLNLSILSAGSNNYYIIYIVVILFKCEVIMLMCFYSSCVETLNYN